MDTPMSVSNSININVDENPVLPTSSNTAEDVPSEVPTSLNTDLDEIPQIPSKINKLDGTNWLKKFLIASGVLFGIGAVCAIITSVTVTQLAKTTTTTISSTTIGSSSSTTAAITILSSSSTTLASSSTIVSSSSSSSSSSSATPTTTGGSTTTLCPTNTCAFVTWYTLTSSGYYGVENVNFTCTQTLSNFTAFIYVQRTVGATYAQEYNTFWGGVMNQTYSTTSSQIIYSWAIISGQTISSSGYPYFIEAQFQLQGTNQTVANDTYSITTQSACNGQVSTYSGHF